MIDVREASLRTVADPASQLLPASVRAAVQRSADRADLTRAFETDLRSLTFRRLRAAGLVFGGLHLLAWLFSATASLSLFLALAPHRTAAIAFSLLFATAPYFPPLEQRAHALSMALTLGTALFVVEPVLIYGLVGGSDYFGMVLLLVCSGVLFPFTARRMSVVSAAILAMYLLAAAIAWEPGAGEALVRGVFYLLAASAVAIVAARLGYRLRRAEFFARHDLLRERDTAEQLLFNILPEPIVRQLEKDQSAIAEGFDEATVLFADIVGFTPISARISPRALVDLLNDIFSRFDALTDKHGLEKIKTIGDAYMVVGGVPIPRSDHAIAVANMALEMRDLIDDLRPATGDRLKLRIGINTGPVVAGVIGTKKFAYDLWGDTVNTAARMEAHADPGTIQITERTHELIRQRFLVEARGPISVKGKGEMPTYLLLGRARPLA
jgi:class 3 adenylate cyclase